MGFVKSAYKDAKENPVYPFRLHECIMCSCVSAHSYGSTDVMAFVGGDGWVKMNRSDMVLYDMLRKSFLKNTISHIISIGIFERSVIRTRVHHLNSKHRRKKKIVVRFI